MEPHNDTTGGKESPAWMKALRAAQGFLGLVIFGMSAYLSSGAYLDVFGLGMVTAIFTWLVISYPLLRKSKWRRFHRQIVKAALDLFMVIMYLAFWAATATQRAGGCDDDDDDDDKGYCKAFSKHKIFFRNGGSSIMAALAGVGALTWILFIVTFIWNVFKFFQDRKAEKKSKDSLPGEAGAEQKSNTANGGTDGHDLEGGGNSARLAPTGADDQVSPVQRSTVSPLHGSYPVSSIHTTPSPVGAVTADDGNARGHPMPTDGSPAQQQQYGNMASQHAAGTSYPDANREAYTMHNLGAVQPSGQTRAGGYQSVPTSLNAVAPSAELGGSNAYSHVLTELSGDGSVMIHQAVDSNRMSETVDAVELDAGQHAQNWSPRGAELPGQ